MNGERDHGLEFLLDFDGRVHVLEGGYWLKFEIKRVAASNRRPHGLAYSFTLHDPVGKRLIGFDNAHGVARKRRRSVRGVATDHWHRTEDDAGRPYAYTDAMTLIDDFFDEVERVLRERGIGTIVVAVHDSKEDK
jgi:hypothetical protein